MRSCKEGSGLYSASHSKLPLLDKSSVWKPSPSTDKGAKEMFQMLTYYLAMKRNNTRYGTDTLKNMQVSHSWMVWASPPLWLWLRRASPVTQSVYVVWGARASGWNAFQFSSFLATTWPTWPPGWLDSNSFMRPRTCAVCPATLPLLLGF